MSSIEFNQDSDPNKIFVRIQNDESNSAMIGFLIRNGYAKNIEQANIILLFISISSFVLMGAVLYFFVFGAPLPSFSSGSNNNAKIIKEYRDQGLKGPELMKKIREARNTGLIK